MPARWQLSQHYALGGMMFTTTFTTDYAIDRWTDSEGFEFGYAHDNSAENPFDWGWEGIAAIAHDSRRIDNGDLSIPRRYEVWLDDYELIQADVADAETSEDAEAATEELLDHEDQRPPVIWFDYEGWTVYVDTEDFDMAPDDATDEQIEELARSRMDTYSQWADGEVYVGAVTTPDGDTEYLAGIYLDPARCDREQIEEFMSDLV